MALLTVSKREKITWKTGIEPDYGFSLPPNNNPNFYRSRWYAYMCTNSGYFNISLKNPNGTSYIGFFRYSISQDKWISIWEKNNVSYSNKNIVINMDKENIASYEGSDSIHFCLIFTYGRHTQKYDLNTLNCYIGNYCTPNKRQYEEYIKGSHIYLRQEISQCSFWAFNDINFASDYGPSTFVANPFDTEWGKIGMMKGQKILPEHAKRLIAYK